jgi:hypothetical protein
MSRPRNNGPDALPRTVTSSYFTVKHIGQQCRCYVKMSWGNCSVRVSSPYGDLHDEPELPRAGLAKAALAGRVNNRQGAGALHITIRQFQRLKRRFEAGGAPALRHRSRGQASPRRLQAKLRAKIAELMTTCPGQKPDRHVPRNCLIAPAPTGGPSCPAAAASEEDCCKKTDRQRR